MAILHWCHIKPMPEKRWTCGFCGTVVASHLGFYRNDGDPGSSLTPKEMVGRVKRLIVICPNCESPTYFDSDHQTPRAPYGRKVRHLPPDLDDVYTQARNCISVNAFVPAVLAARTILMHIAVEQGAKEGEPFATYVDHLVKGGYVPPNAKPWVDHVRLKGNAATHKIALMGREDAEKVLRFVEMILLFLYEYPNMT